MALAPQHRPGAEAESLPGGGADDAVGAEPVAALEALDRALGLRAEHAVGRDPQHVLELPHLAARLRGLGGRCGAEEGDQESGC